MGERLLIAMLALTLGCGLRAEESGESAHGGGESSTAENASDDGKESDGKDEKSEEEKKEQEEKDKLREELTSFTGTATPEQVEQTNLLLQELVDLQNQEGVTEERTQQINELTEARSRMLESFNDSGSVIDQPASPGLPSESLAPAAAVASPTPESTQAAALQIFNPAPVTAAPTPAPPAPALAVQSSGSPLGPVALSGGTPLDRAQSAAAPLAPISRVPQQPAPAPAPPPQTAVPPAVGAADAESLPVYRPTVAPQETTAQELPPLPPPRYETPETDIRVAPSAVRSAALQEPAAPAAPPPAAPPPPASAKPQAEEILPILRRSADAVAAVPTGEVSSSSAVSSKERALADSRYTAEDFQVGPAEPAPERPSERSRAFDWEERPEEPQAETARPEPALPDLPNPRRLLEEAEEPRDETGDKAVEEEKPKAPKKRAAQRALFTTDLSDFAEEVAQKDEPENSPTTDLLSFLRAKLP
jgi:hypothetical protein